MLSFRFRHRAYCLTIWHLRIVELGLDFKLVLQFGARYLNMGLAQSTKKHVARFRVLFQGYRRILLFKPVEPGNYLILLALLLGGYSLEYTGFWELKLSKYDWRGAIA